MKLSPLAKTAAKSALAILGATTLYFAVPLVYDAELPWLKRYAAIIVVGVVYSLGVLFMATPRLLFRLSQIPFCSPNWLSIQRIWIIWLGQWLFFAADGNVNRLFAGFLILVFAHLLDRLDGKQAKSILAMIKIVPQANDNSGLMANSSLLWAWYSVEEENAQGEKVRRDQRVILEIWITNLSTHHTIVPMFHLARDETARPPALRLSLTGIGEWLDPLSDKFNLLPLLAYLAWRDMICWPVVALMVVSDIVSTIVREPFLSWPGFRRLRKYTSEMKASPFGKTKVIWQILSLLALLPAVAGWLNPTELQQSRLIASYLLGLGVLAGVLSTASRLTVWHSLIQAAGLRRAYHKFRKGYEHEVEEEME